MAWCRQAVSHYHNQFDRVFVALTGELWGVYHEDFEGNWQHYNGTALYTKLHNLDCVLAMKLFAVFSIVTHWGRVTHICVSNLTIIGSDNGFSPGRRQAITWTNVVILLIGPLGTNFSEMLIEIHTFSFTKIHLKMSGKWRPFCLGLNVVTHPHGLERVHSFPVFCLWTDGNMNRFLSQYNSISDTHFPWNK